VEARPAARVEAVDRLLLLRRPNRLTEPTDSPADAD
jgi:hypothetical protein